jgi:hypothetical protein
MMWWDDGLDDNNVVHTGEIHTKDNSHCLQSWKGSTLNWKHTFADRSITITRPGYVIHNVHAPVLVIALHTWVYDSSAYIENMGREVISLFAVVEPATLDFIPQDLWFYVWHHCINSLFFWQYLDQFHPILEIQIDVEYDELGVFMGDGSNEPSFMRIGTASSAISEDWVQRIRNTSHFAEVHVSPGKTWNLRSGETPIIIDIYRGRHI